jgi:hypothetical protein
MIIEQHSNYKYHLEMMLQELEKKHKSPNGDTRIYLSLDETEYEIVKRKLEEELKTTIRILENKG